MTDDYFCCIGIDTSNYKTSMALVDNEGNIISNVQKYLDVKKGERGLRQSTALFQHVNNLPEISGSVFFGLDDAVRKSIRCIAVSTKPRPVEGSYMPVFNAGASTAKTLAAAMDIPCYEFSHQEGHIEAVRHYSPLKEKKRFVTFHFSGGTTEAVLVEESTSGETKYTIVGGSRDLAFGQVLDRVGVSLNMDFPCGEQLDKIAVNEVIADKADLPVIKCEDGYINLSGIETKCQRSIGEIDDESLIAALFQRITEAIGRMTIQISRKYRVYDFLYAGGVSASNYVRNNLNDHTKSDINCYFGDPKLSTDNAVGIALLGGKKYAFETY